MAGLPPEFSTDVENYVEKRAPAGPRFPGRAEIAWLPLGERVRSRWTPRVPQGEGLENAGVSASGQAKAR